MKYSSGISPLTTGAIGTGTGGIIEPPGEYVAEAVDFSSGDVLSRATALTATNSSSGFISGWVNMVDTVTAFFRNNDDTLRVSFGTSDRQVHVELAEVNFDSYLSADTDFNVLPVAGVWFHLLVAWDTDFAAASRRVAVYVDGVVAPVVFGDDEGVAFEVGWDTPVNSRMGAAFDNFGVADVSLWIGTNIVLADSTVSPTNLAKFISGGKPVDPATAIAAFGNPAILFSGDAAAFVVNQGTGGAFTLTGSITDADASEPVEVGGGEEEDDMTIARVTVSSAELLALFDTPKLLIAAPGAGKFIRPTFIDSFLTGVSTAYITSENPVNVQWGTAGLAVVDAINFDGVETDSAQILAVSTGGLMDPESIVENLGLYLACAANPTDGDGTLTLEIVYRIVDLP